MMTMTTNQFNEHFVSLSIHVDVLQQLLDSKALYIEHIHCPNSTSKALIRRLLMQSLKQEGR